VNPYDLDRRIDDLYKYVPLVDQIALL